MGQGGVGKQRVLEDAAPDLDHRDVSLLNAGRRVRGHAQAMIAQRLELAARPAGQADHGQALGAQELVGQLGALGLQRGEQPRLGLERAAQGLGAEHAGGDDPGGRSVDVGDGCRRQAAVARTRDFAFGVRRFIPRHRQTKC